VFKVARGSAGVIAAVDEGFPALQDDVMARTLLVAPTAAGVGLARTCLGLVRALDRRGLHAAFVKPVAQLRADGSPDRSNALVAAITALRPPDPLSTGTAGGKRSPGWTRPGETVDSLAKMLAMIAVPLAAAVQAASITAWVWPARRVRGAPRPT